MPERLSRTDKARAMRAINNVHRIFYSQRGTPRDDATAVQQRSGRIAEQVFALAVHACRQSATEACELFERLCAYAEGRYKREHNAESIADSLPVWRVYKINILHALRLKLRPTDYTCEHALRQAARGAAIGSADSERAELVAMAANRRPLELDQLTQLLGASTKTELTRRHLLRVLLTIEALPMSASKHVEKALERLAQDLSIHLV